MRPHPRRTLVALVAGAGAAAAAWIGVAQAASSSVTVGDNDYRPATVTIDAGDTVTWTYNGQSVHTVTADDGSFDSGTMERGVPYARRFDAPGTYGYYCTFHGAPGEGQAGTVVVRARASTTTAPAAPTPGATTSTTRPAPTTTATTATTIPAQDIGFDDRSTPTSALSLAPASVPSIDGIAPPPTRRGAAGAARDEGALRASDEGTALVTSRALTDGLPDGPVVAGVVLIVAVLGALTSHLLRVDGPGE